MIQFLSGKYRTIIVRFWQFGLLFLGGIILYVVAVYFNFFWLFGTMPDLKAIENPNSQQASEIISADGQTLGKYFFENRTHNTGVTHDRTSQMHHARTSKIHIAIAQPNRSEERRVGKEC